MRFLWKRTKRIEYESPMCGACGEEEPVIFVRKGMRTEPDNPWCWSCTYMLMSPLDSGYNNVHKPVGNVIQQ